MKPTPIRPAIQPHDGGVAAFIQAATAKFISSNEIQPQGAILILYDGDRTPFVSMHCVAPVDCTFAAAWLNKMALDCVGCFSDGEAA